MKAEERKALERNELAVELGKAIETLKHGPSRSTMIYLAIALFGILAILLFRWFWSSSELAASKRWVNLDEIVFPTQLATAVEGDLKDTPQGRLAKFKQARMLLSLGIQDFATNHSLAQKNLSEGTRLYEELIDKSTRIPLLHQEALWGAAKGNESLGEIEKAKKYYTELSEKYASTSLGKDAAKQLQRLKAALERGEIDELQKEFSTK